LQKNTTFIFPLDNISARKLFLRDNKHFALYEMLKNLPVRVVNLYRRCKFMYLNFFGYQLITLLHSCSKHNARSVLLFWSMTKSVTIIIC